MSWKAFLLSSSSPSPSLLLSLLLLLLLLLSLLSYSSSSTCECASCRTLLRTPSAAAAQGLPPGQAGAPAQQLPAQQATTRPTAACHLSLMTRTAISCCCWTLLRSCTRLPLMTALSPQLLLPMVCTVMMCISFNGFCSTSVKDPCEKACLHMQHARVVVIAV